MEPRVLARLSLQGDLSSTQVSEPSIPLNQGAIRQRDAGRCNPAYAQCKFFSLRWKSLRAQPGLMIEFALGGIVTSLGHHFYYVFRNGKTVASAQEQQWTSRLGTAFAFITIAFLRAAISGAYDQYIWTVVQRKGLSVEGLDRMFSLSSDPTGFLDRELLRKTKSVLLIASIFW